MSRKKFRNLDIDLPSQPFVDQRPFMVTGILIAFLILLLFACAYINNIKNQSVQRQQTETMKPQQEIK